MLKKVYVEIDKAKDYIVSTKQYRLEEFYILQTKIQGKLEKEISFISQDY